MRKKNLLCHKMAGVQSYLMPQTTIVRQKQPHAANNGMQKKQKGHIMTEKEKNILNQELWSLVALGFDSTKHDFEIMEKMLKCVSRDEEDEMTPNKRKVIEELQLEWRFLKELHKDLGRIAAKLGKSEIVPAVPTLVISDELWETDKSGSSDALYETTDKISDFQSAIQDCAFKLQEVCA